VTACCMWVAVPGDREVSGQAVSRLRCGEVSTVQSCCFWMQVAVVCFRILHTLPRFGIQQQDADGSATRRRRHQPAAVLPADG
jgi:hypothetical protein